MLGKRGEIHGYPAPIGRNDVSDSSTPPRSAPKIFLTNTRVLEKIDGLRSQMLTDLKTPDGLKLGYETDSFHMPHSSSPDSLFGLYYGKMILRPTITNNKKVTISWRAEVPWVWPSYE